MILFKLRANKKGAGIGDEKLVMEHIVYVPKQFPELTETEQNDVGEFLHPLDEHDAVHRVWAAVKQLFIVRLQGVAPCDLRFGATRDGSLSPPSPCKRLFPH